MLICPVFHEDELFCWVTNCLHQYDIGGITPSSFCPAAESAYDEGILIPPVKIVESNVIRRDIEEIYLRASRKPEMVAHDFRAQLAGNTTAKTRIAALIERYGSATVKGVMKRIIDNAEKAFLDKMARLPAGEWQERTYVESYRQFSCPGCGTLIENEVAVESVPVLRDIELRLPNPGLAPGSRPSPALRAR